MTVQEAIHKLVSWAEQQIGTREGPNNWNKYADSADITKLFGWNVQNQPWCAVFVSAGFITCFGYDIGSAMIYQYAGCNGAACRYSADYYKAHGAWHTVPQLGDQIFFYYNGDINHTGIVTYVGEGSIVTVEGNSSDMVARRSYQIGASQIAGYGRPNWALVEKADIPVSPKPVEEKPIEQPVEEKPVEQKPDRQYHDYVYTVRLNLLKEGDYGPLVKSVQALLNLHGANLAVDGKFGNSTKIAVMSFQSKNGLTVDGEVGGQTYKALLGV